VLVLIKKKTVYISFLFLFVLLLQSLYCQTTAYKIRTISFYNVENLFDTIDNPETFDDDFTKIGKYKYSSRIYWDKIERLSKVISEIGYEKTNTGPVIVGLAEIENRSVLEDLINSKNLKNEQYNIVHFDSPDRRGIDVALLYKENFFKPLDQKAFEVRLWDESGKRILTRDQLLVTGLLDDELIHIIVNHWPSRRGGQLRSSSKREKSAYVTTQIIEIINAEYVNPKIIIMGDFNDDPIDISIKEGLKSTGDLKKLKKNILFNPMERMFKSGFNTLGYRDGLNLFDQILLSEACINMNNSYNSFKFYKAGIFNPNYLITQDGRYVGYPLRTYKNETYNKGYSDHFPVYIYLIKKSKFTIENNK
jgi:exonuclease III